MMRSTKRCGPVMPSSACMRLEEDSRPCATAQRTCMKTSASPKGCASGVSGTTVRSWGGLNASIKPEPQPLGKVGAIGAQFDRAAEARSQSARAVFVLPVLVQDRQRDQHESDEA